MIIVLKPNTKQEDVSRVEHLVKRRGLDTHIVVGQEMTIIGCIGDTTKIDAKLFEVDASVDKVMHVQEPYKLANRAFHPEDSVVDVSGVKVGRGHLALIAGPCSVESAQQVLEIAAAAKQSGANLLRGGAFKPRTSPYSFQGMGLDGLKILCEAKEATGLPIVTELMSPEYLDIFNEKVDLTQPMKNGSCPRSISWRPAMKMSFSVSGVSAHSRRIRATPLTCRAFRCSVSSPTFLSS